MKTEDRRCPVCREVFTPSNGKQEICVRCRPYYYVSPRSGKHRTLSEARGLYLLDVTGKGLKASELPAAPGCDGCFYWRTIGGNAGNLACHYCFDTGNKRPCLPGKHCTVRRTK